MLWKITEHYLFSPHHCRSTAVEMDAVLGFSVKQALEASWQDDDARVVSKEVKLPKIWWNGHQMLWSPQSPTPPCT